MPSAAQVKNKKQKFSGTPNGPGTTTDAAPPVPPSGTQVELGEQGSRALAKLCRCYQVKPEHVVRSIVEGFLADACSDDTLAPLEADCARVIERTGSVPPSWWEGKDKILLPGFEEEPAEAAAPPPQPPLPLRAPSNLLLLRERARESVAGMRAYYVAGNSQWPRVFDVPGIGFGREMSACEVVSHVCMVLHTVAPELHALAVEYLPTRPAEMAELAEVLAIVEEVCCSGGLKTDLDETPSGQLSGLGKFAATAKALALLKPPGSEKRPRTKGGRK